MSAAASAAALAVPTPRTPTEPSHPTAPRSGVRDEPGWLSLVEALDEFSAGLVARLEHERCRADARAARRLERQLLRARRLEAVMADAAEQARHHHDSPRATHPAARAHPDQEDRHAQP